MKKIFLFYKKRFFCLLLFFMAGLFLLLKNLKGRKALPTSSKVLETKRSVDIPKTENFLIFSKPPAHEKLEKKINFGSSLLEEEHSYYNQIILKQTGVYSKKEYFFDGEWLLKAYLNHIVAMLTKSVKFPSAVYIKPELSLRAYWQIAPDLNAGATGYSLFFIHTRTFLDAENEDALLGVVGHELAHLILGHTVRNGGCLSNRFSRMDEIAADHLGLILFSSTGQNPNGFLKGLELIQNSVGDHKSARTFSFERQKVDHYSDPLQDCYALTHPITKDRISTIEQAIDDLPARKWIKKSKENNFWLSQARMLYYLESQNMLAESGHHGAEIREIFQGWLTDHNQVKRDAGLYGLTLLLMRENKIAQAEKQLDMVSEDLLNHAYLVHVKAQLMQCKGEKLSATAIEKVGNAFSEQFGKDVSAGVRSMLLTQQGDIEAAITNLERFLAAPHALTFQDDLMKQLVQLYFKSEKNQLKAEELSGDLESLRSNKAQAIAHYKEALALALKEKNLEKIKLLTHKISQSS